MYAPPSHERGLLYNLQMDMLQGSFGLHALSESVHEVLHFATHFTLLCRTSSQHLCRKCSAGSAQARAGTDQAGTSPQSAGLIEWTHNKTNWQQTMCHYSLACNR